jgi:hypothetical protein
MGADHPRILIAAPGPVIKELASALTGEAEIVGGQTFEEAVGKLHGLRPDLIIVCYVFDEARPFRLLQYARNERPAHVPTILVRALPIPLGRTQEAQIRESYNALGVDEFINLNDAKERYGKQEALRQFRDAVISRLPMGQTRYGARTDTKGGPAE